MIMVLIRPPKMRSASDRRLVPANSFRLGASRWIDEHDDPGVVGLIKSPTIWLKQFH